MTPAFLAPGISLGPKSKGNHMAIPSTTVAKKWAREYETIYILRPDVSTEDAAKIAARVPEVVERLSRLPIGSVSRQAIGGRRWHVDPGPVEIDVELVSLRSGAFDLVDLHSHLASMNGSKFDMAGRVFTGSPAPTNLVIPPHKIDGMKLVIGIGQDGKEA